MYKTTTFLILTVLIASISFSVYAKDSAKDKKSITAESKSVVNPYGKAFVGEGLEIELAVYDEKNSDGLQDALIKFTGGPAHEAGIDGKVMKYSAEPAGTGFNYNYTKDDEKRTRMLTRSSWGSWTFFEVFLNNKTYKVYVDEKKSKDVKPLELLKSFEK